MSGQVHNQLQNDQDRNGGGLASAVFFASRGARVTVTDLKSREELEVPLEELKCFSIRYVLGKHEKKDFSSSDLIMKNPAVPQDSPFLEFGRSRGIPIESDISLFLRRTSSPILAVTGSKGKSTTASAIYHVLKKSYPDCRLGGNITVSPLMFPEELSPDTPVVLELSSWQLGDIRGKGILKPLISLTTVLLPDHMNRYSGMDEYIEDKKLIFQDQNREDFALFNRDDPLQKDFPKATKARSFFFSSEALPDGREGAWLEKGGAGKIRINGIEDEIFGRRLLVLGEHNRTNLLAAGLALALYGIKPGEIRAGLSSFPGIEHRLEFFAEINGIRFYNDSAATIPHATSWALRALPLPIHLITGGTDKNIDFSPLEEVVTIPDRIILLEGSGTDKIISILKSLNVPYEGPFDNLAEAVSRSYEGSSPGSSVLFSPACTSFGMFRNEFERGRQFKETVMALQQEAGG